MVQVDIMCLLVRGNEKNTASLQWSIIFLPKNNLQESLITRNHQTKPNEGAFYGVTRLYFFKLLRTIKTR